MKKILYLITFIVSIALVACDKDNVTPIQPSDISNVAYEARPGSIKLTWDVPADSNYKYVKVTYYDYLKKKEMMRLASVYSDSIIIPDTRQKYGEYKFNLQPFSSTETGGSVKTITATSGPAPSSFTIDKVVPLTLSNEGLFVDNQEPSEGPKKNLLDGDVSTYYHANWSSPTPMPHYIVVKLPKKVHALSFSYTTRNHSGVGNHPKHMNVYVSNVFDGTTYDVSELQPVAEIKSGLPSGAAKEYSSNAIILDDEYEYVWFEVKETHGGTEYFALSELKVNEVTLNIYDPEAPEEGE